MYRIWIDGKQMTLKEIAEMIGVTREQLYRYHVKHQVSYGAIVRWWRDGMIRFGPKPGMRAAVHMVDGKWMTDAEIADMVGVHVQSIRNYCSTRQCLRSEAVQYYREINAGIRKRHPGSKPLMHKVHGVWMTEYEAAEKYRTKCSTLRVYRYKHGCSLDTAVRRLEARRQRRAERDLIEILKEATT